MKCKDESCARQAKLGSEHCSAYCARATPSSGATSIKFNEKQGIYGLRVHGEKSLESCVREHNNPKETMPEERYPGSQKKKEIPVEQSTGKTPNDTEGSPESLGTTYQTQRELNTMREETNKTSPNEGNSMNERDLATQITTSRDARMRENGESSVLPSHSDSSIVLNAESLISVNSLDDSANMLFQTMKDAAGKTKTEKLNVEAVRAICQCAKEIVGIQRLKFDIARASRQGKRGQW